MTMEDQDWLDRRLAVDKYIPDEGFTARVIDRLPAQQSRSLVMRCRILAAAAFLAVCLVAVQIGPLFHSIRQLMADHSVAEIFGLVATIAQRPVFLFSVAAGMTILAVASIPLLRRWV